jgi:hypothetical protein
MHRQHQLLQGLVHIVPAMVPAYALVLLFSIVLQKLLAARTQLGQLFT